MKTVGKILALLGGLSVLTLGAPLDERLAAARTRHDPTVAPTVAPSRTPTPRSVSRQAILAGGDNCSTPTDILTLPFPDTGTTSGKSNDSSGFLLGSCSTGELSRPGPDVIYRFNIAGVGNSLTFTVVPSA